MRDLKLPESLRETLKRPFGRLIKREKEAPEIVKKELEKFSGRLIIVGDATYENLLKLGVKPHLAVLDFKIKRMKHKEYPYTVKVKSPAGSITSELWDAIQKNMEKGGVIYVEGEEDLATLPCILEANFGDAVLYGQPDEGIVFINVNEESKQKTAMFIRLMEMES